MTPAAAGRRLSPLAGGRLRADRERLWSGIWLLLLLVHLPLVWLDWSRLLAGAGGEIRWGGFVTLHLSIVLFLLKAARCRWLQLKRDWRSLVLLGVALAVMHGHVLLPEAALGAADLSVAGTIMLIGGLTPVQRLLADWLERPRPTGQRRRRFRRAALQAVVRWTARAGEPHLGRAPPPLA